MWSLAYAILIFKGKEDEIYEPQLVQEIVGISTDSLQTSHLDSFHLLIAFLFGLTNGRLLKDHSNSL